MMAVRDIHGHTHRVHSLNDLRAVRSETEVGFVGRWSMLLSGRGKLMREWRECRGRVTPRHGDYSLVWFPWTEYTGGNILESDFRPVSP
jgi:hypothetical protein